jgi:hypothetical protein
VKACVDGEALHSQNYKNNVTCINIATQRLGKQASTTEKMCSVWSEPRPLLCNGSVTRFNKGDCVFCVVRAEELS